MSPSFTLAHFLHHEVSCQLRTGKLKDGFLRWQLSHLTGLKVSRTDLIMAIGDGIRKAPPEQSDHTQGSSHQDRSLFFCRNRSTQGVHRGHSNWSTSVPTPLQRLKKLQHRKPYLFTLICKRKEKDGEIHRILLM